MPPVFLHVKPFPIAHLANVVAEVELAHVLVQVLLADVVKDAVDAMPNGMLSAQFR